MQHTGISPSFDDQGNVLIDSRFLEVVLETSAEQLGADIRSGDLRHTFEEEEGPYGPCLRVTFLHRDRRCSIRVDSQSGAVIADA